jgi:hypothetical protein
MPRLLFIVLIFVTLGFALQNEDASQSAQEQKVLKDILMQQKGIRDYDWESWGNDD